MSVYYSLQLVLEGSDESDYRAIVFRAARQSTSKDTWDLKVHTGNPCVVSCTSPQHLHKSTTDSFCYVCRGFFAQVIRDTDANSYHLSFNSLNSVDGADRREDISNPTAAKNIPKSGPVLYRYMMFGEQASSFSSISSHTPSDGKVGALCV